MFNTPCIKVSFVVGSDLKECIKSSIAMANRLWCYIDMDFNDMSILVNWNSDPNEVYDRYMKITTIPIANILKDDKNAQPDTNPPK